jgi:broad specificity phosphatase PhoE
MLANLPLTTTPLPGYPLPPVPPKGARVILMRHGRSNLNDAGRYQGSSDDSQLTAKGRLASRQVGQYLRHCAIDHLYTSPLSRAQQTVQELLPQLATPTPITTTGVLREIDLPAWEGLLYDEVKTRFPDAYRCWQIAPQQFAMARGDGGMGSRRGSGFPKGRGDGEMSPQDDSESLLYPVRDVYRRARKFWTTTLPRHQGQTLLVVSHGGTIQALVNTALGLPMMQHHEMQQTHSGLTVIDFAANAAALALGAGHLHLLNLTTPMGEQLPKLKAGKQGLRLVLLPCQMDTQPDATLAQLVQGHPIAACVVEDHPCCHPNQRSLLTHHPETVTISVGRADFLHHWQRSLLQSLKQAPHAELTTVTAVCHQAHAESFLRGVMGRPLPLLPNALTVLHYPAVGVRPILQTLNSRPIPSDS